MWPFSPRIEKRSTSSYTDALVAVLTEGAAGARGGDWRQVAIVQAAAGMIGRSLAIASVQGAPISRTGLTPAVLHRIGSSLVTDGEAVFMIQVQDSGVVKLIPVSDYQVTGGPEEAEWRYRCTWSGPSAARDVSLPYDAVIHVRLDPDPASPHKGRSPLTKASKSAKLLAGIERQLSDEAGQPSGSLLPAPTASLKDDDEVALKADLKRLAGRLALVPSMVSGWSEGRAAAPSEDWRTRRIGLDPPEGLLAAREAAGRDVLAAIGIPPVMFSTGGQAAVLREGLRTYLHTCLSPLAKVVEEEVTAKLGVQVTLNLDNLHAADVQGRARAYKSLVDGNMEPAQAAAATGMAEA